MVLILKFRTVTLDTVQYMVFGLHGVNGQTVSRFSAEWPIEHDLGHVTHLLQHMVAVTVREKVKRLRAVGVCYVRQQNAWCVLRIQKTLLHFLYEKRCRKSLEH
ncbi:uncharacterized protein LOC130052133 [Ostrea edulis]|uniref:uncharacterized protein LOC130052133 n=1 Tax=Ostrea edulis TaxID=37623 RepID=UPI0024AFA675|nr:uncharacterized protein LOC130052133 [Ostrea edulis]